MVLYVLPGVLVAHASLHAEFVEGAGIFAVACEDRVLVFILAARGGIVDVLQIVLRVGGGVVQLQLASEAQRLSCSDGHGVVHLEGVARRLVLVLRVAVGQVHDGRLGIKEVGHLRLGRTVLQLVGQCQRLGVVLIEEALVVEASVERGARVLHLRRAVVAEAVAVGRSAHLGQRGASGLHRHRVHLCREVQHAHRVDLVAQRQASHRERGLQVVVRGQQLAVAVRLNLLGLRRRVAGLVIRGHHVGAV